MKRFVNNITWTYILQFLLVLALLFTVYRQQVMVNYNNERGMLAMMHDTPGKKGNSIHVQFERYDETFDIEMIHIIEHAFTNIKEKYPDYQVSYELGKKEVVFDKIDGQEHYLNLMPFTPLMHEKTILDEGRYPEKEHEIIIDGRMNAGGKFGYKVGDVIEVNKMWDEEPKTIVGIYNRMGEGISKVMRMPEDIQLDVLLFENSYITSINKKNELEAEPEFPFVPSLSIYSWEQRMTRDEFTIILEEAGLDSSSKIYKTFWVNDAGSDGISHKIYETFEISRNIGKILIFLESIVIIGISLYRFYRMKARRLVDWQNGVSKKEQLTKELLLLSAIISLAVLIFVAVVTLVPAVTLVPRPKILSEYYEEINLLQDIDRITMQYVVPMQTTFIIQTLQEVLISGIIWLVLEWSCFKMANYSKQFVNALLSKE